MRRLAVVGSGPSGVASAHALLRAGCSVTMIDVGLRIDPELLPYVRSRAPIAKDAFLETVHRRRRRTLGANPHFPMKVPLGSDFAYRERPETRVSMDASAKVIASLAYGGLSNAWGANVCAIAEHDMGDWPLRASELTPYFRLVKEFLPVSARSDGLDELYPFSLGDEENYEIGPQGRDLLEELGPHQERLRGAGIYAGRAKLAIGRRYATNGKGCVSCGLCMHGCPYEAIFNSASVVERLASQTGFTYRAGLLVERFAESKGGVTIDLKDLQSGATERLVVDKLFLACGPLNTTAVVARSLGWCDHVFTVKDSQKYLFPFLRRRRSRGALREPGNTLSQLFVQATGLRSTSHIVHGQLYGYNDLMIDALRSRIGGWADRLGALAAPAFERLMIGMVYLHSDDSGTLEFRVSPDPGRGYGAVRGVPARARSDAVLGEFLGRLLEARQEFGGRPIRAGVKRLLPGESIHYGGTLPMRETPQKFESDVLGRPWGCQNVHGVDASILPSIPATPPALVLMANAARISDQALRK